MLELIGFELNDDSIIGSPCSEELVQQILEIDDLYEASRLIAEENALVE